MVSGFISDGYTEPGYVAEASRLHPAVKFEFRPVLASEKAVYIQALDEKYKEPQLRKMEATILHRALVRWDISDGRKVVEVTEANLLRLKPALLSKLFRMAVGEIPTDEEPGTVPADPVGCDLLEALRQGAPVASVRQERLEKN